MTTEAACCTGPAAIPATPAETTCCPATPAASARAVSSTRLRLGIVLGGAGAAALITVADPIWARTLTGVGLDPDSALGAAVHFALYETGKILALIAVLVFAIGVLGTWLTPARLQRLLAGRGQVAGHAIAAGFGAVTPFCSCSSVPLYVSMTRAGVPTGVGLTFLVASPLVNEVALALLASMAGWAVAAAYLALGLTIAVATGATVGALARRREASAPSLLPLAMPVPRPTLDDRLRAGLAEAKGTLRKLWPFVVGAITVGAVIHGWIPTDIIARLGDQWWGVPAAVLLGIPLYSATATAVPLIAPLYAAGIPLGTLIALMMAVVGLSAPELIMLRKAMPARVLVTFVGVVASGIVAAGYLLNALT